mgnify:CR=1 FL=1|jgi:2-polyprenyl-6-methoxyphenol hydroxylase-like FAD-dependent oxidoreductase
MAMEDAWVFAHFASSHDDTKSALKAYEDARLERTSKVQHAAWEQGQKSHRVGKVEDTDEFKGGNFAKLDWIYGYNVCALYP